MVTNGHFGGPNGDGLGRVTPDPRRITDRQGFGAELTLARERAGKTVRMLAAEVDQPSATIGGYFSGRNLPPLRQTDVFRQLLASLGITVDDEVEPWLAALDLLRRKPGPRAADAPVPYRGLESFRSEDAEWFHGREALTDDIVAMLVERLDDEDGARMIAVVGASGAGKSSLIQAGVIPAVLAGRLGHDACWQPVVLTPGDRPVRALAEGLAAVVGLGPDEVEAGLRADASGLPVVPGDVRVVVVVDQFEELFTLCADEAEQRRFIATLDRLSAAAGGLVVLLGLRADFYARATCEPALVPVLQRHQAIVGSMRPEELRRAIVEPARRAATEVDPELVELLMRDFLPRGLPSCADDPGALPLLSHALLETFNRARKGRLTIDDYVGAGGVSGAIRQTAETAFDELAPDEQELARSVFLRLVSVNEDAVVTRRRVRRSELGATAASDGGAGGLNGAVASVVDRFVACRLLTLHENEVAVSHEALLSAWPRLVGWIDADRAGLRLHRQLTEAASLWAESGRDADGLLRGGRLEAAVAWAGVGDHDKDLNDEERSFLDAGVHQEGKRLVTVRRRARLRQGVVALVASLALVAGGLAVAAVKARNSAERVRDVALSRQVALEAVQLRASDPTLAAQLALASYRISPTAEARSALLDTTAAPVPARVAGQPGTTALAVSGDGRAMAVGRASDGTVELYALTTDGMAHRGALDPPATGVTPFTAAFSPHNSMMAVGGTDDQVQLWDVADLARPRRVGFPLGGFAGTVLGAAFSPDGLTLAAVGASTSGVLRWDIADPGRPVALATLLPGGPSTYTVAFSADGATVASGGTDGTVRLWNVAGETPRLTAELPSTAPTTINSVAFSLDGRFLAAGDKRKEVRVWDISRGPAPVEASPPLTGSGSWVNSVSFSPDGRTLAAGGSDSAIRFWDVTTWQPRALVLPNPAPVTALAYLPGTSGLVSVAGDGVARLWPRPAPLIEGAGDSVYALTYSADGQRLVVVPTRARGIPVWDPSGAHPRRLGEARLPTELGVPAGSGAISPNGRVLAAGTSTGFVQLFDVTDPASPALLGPPLVQSTTLVEQIYFSPDGRLLAAGGDDNAIAMWDVSDPAHPRALPRLTGFMKPVLGIAFSADSRAVAAGSGDKTVRLWDIAEPERPVATATLGGFDDVVYSVAFSTGSRLLAAGSADKTVRLWDVSDPADPRLVGRALTGPTSSVNTVAIDPQGRTLAAGVSGGKVWQWDISDPAHPRHKATLSVATGDINVLAYSPDGRALVAAGADKTVYQWATDDEQAASAVCAAVGDRISQAEWRMYIPDRQYTPPCR